MVRLRQQGSGKPYRGQTVGASVVENRPSHTVIFKRLVESFSREQRVDVIDLARVIEQNIEFLTQYNMRLHYPDFTHLLNEMRQQQNAETEQESTEISLPPLFSGLPSADCALAWDLVQYLSPPEVTELSRKLSDSIRRGGLVYLVNSTHARISREPMFCTVQDDAHILFKGCQAEEKSSPGYSQREVLELMPEFQLMHATLLQNGLQEMLLQKS